MIDLTALEQSQSELEEAQRTMDRILLELASERPLDDVQVRESKPRSAWLDLADMICHEPYRGKR